jgi:hypothetical protein
MPKKRKTNRGRLSRVSVRAELREEVDWDKFAYAVLQHARLTLAANKAAAETAKDRPNP